MKRFSLRKKSAVLVVINDETTVVTQVNLALFRGLLAPHIFGCIRISNMRETTAEIWIGHAEGSDWMGTQGGLNASHLLLLRENSRPAYLALSALKSVSLLTEVRISLVPLFTRRMCTDGAHIASSAFRFLWCRIKLPTLYFSG